MTQLGVTLYLENTSGQTSELLTTITQLGVTLYLENTDGQNLRTPDGHNPTG
jgi:hypothetical protein